MIAEGGNFLHRMLLGDIISSMQTELGDMVRAIAANMQTQAAQGNVIGILTGGVHAFITAVAGSIIMALLINQLADLGSAQGRASPTAKGGVLPGSWPG